PHVDLLGAEHQRGPRRFAVPWIEHPDLHAKDLSIPIGATRHIAHIDDEMIDRAYLDRHELILCSRFLARPRHWPRYGLFVTTPVVRQQSNRRSGLRIRTQGSNCMPSRRAAIGVLAIGFAALLSTARVASAV